MGRYVLVLSQIPPPCVPIHTRLTLCFTYRKFTQQDPASTHASCPTRGGTKWTATKVGFCVPKSSFFLKFFFVEYGR